MCSRGKHKDVAFCPHVGYNCRKDDKCFSTDDTEQPLYCPAGTVPNKLQCGNTAYGCYDKKTRSCKDKNGVAMFDPIGGAVGSVSTLYIATMTMIEKLFGGSGHVSVENQIKVNNFIQSNFTKIGGLIASADDVSRLSSMTTTVANTVRTTDIPKTIKKVRKVCQRGGKATTLMDLMLTGLLYNQARKHNSATKFEGGKITIAGKPVQFTREQIESALRPH